MRRKDEPRFTGPVTKNGHTARWQDIQAVTGLAKESCVQRIRRWYRGEVELETLYMSADELRRLRKKQFADRMRGQRASKMTDGGAPLSKLRNSDVTKEAARKLAAAVILSAFTVGRHEIDFRFLCGEKGDVRMWLEMAGIEDDEAFISLARKMRRHGVASTKDHVRRVRAAIAGYMVKKS